MAMITLHSNAASAPVRKETPMAPARDLRAKTRDLVRRHGVWPLAAVLVVGAGVLWYSGTFNAAKPLYASAAVQRGDVESAVVAAGIVQPVSYVDVGAQTSGKLKTLKVKRGDSVKTNDLLAEIDPILAESALAASGAALENIGAQYSLKQAQLRLTKILLDRADALVAKGWIAQGAQDLAKANYEVAFADTASMSAQMKQASAAIETAEANLGYTKITAPADGEVVSIALLEGQTLNANQQAPNILRIADISTVTVWAQVSEADIIRVKSGQAVHFTVLGDTRRWDGTIRQILPTPELINNVVFYDVLFDIPNPEHVLKIQMTAQVFIVLAEAKGVLLIPTAAVGNANEGAKINVRVLKADGSVESRPIKIGIKSEILAEIIEGLRESELVVTNDIKVAGKTQSVLSARRGP